jgi:4-hydroxymandelate oxidase
VGGEVEIYIDGGIRRGTDVVKALSLGARAVAIGRPILWGLAANGEAGVQHVLTLLKEEIENALRKCGCKDVMGPSRALVLRRR